MNARTQLCTTRFSRQEAKLVNEYLYKNQIFDSFSSLVRVATLQFIQECESLSLVKQPSPQKKRPKFLWDHDLSEFEVREILSHSGFPPKKLWLIERILNEARFDEVFQYLDLNTITLSLPQLRLKEKICARWQYALERWSSCG